MIIAIFWTLYLLAAFAPLQWSVYLFFVGLSFGSFNTIVGDINLTPYAVCAPLIAAKAIASRARHITDDMFMTAAHTLAHLVSEADLEQGSLYPALPRIREVSAHIGTAVANTAFKNGLADRPQPEDVFADVEAQMYNPRYRSYV